MTKNEVLAEVGKRLGDDSANFLSDVLSPIYDETVFEMAANGCILTLRQTTTFSLVYNQRDYSLDAASGLGTDIFPIEVQKLIVPQWGVAGILERKEERDFDAIRISHTDSTGAAVPGQPRIWRIFPNETNLQVDPVPDAASAVSCEITFIAPPTILADGDPVAEIRRQYIPVVIAGMMTHGLQFQDETVTNLFDGKTAPVFFEAGMARMKERSFAEPGRAKRVKRHPVY